MESATEGLTPYIVFVALVAASGGLLFGYDLGVTGGVTAMPDFLARFFPGIAAAQQAGPAPGAARQVQYCLFDDQGLQLFTSSLYLAGTASTLAGSYTSRRWGRRNTMLLAGVCFLAGVVLCSAASALAMLIVGRILLGLGVGFANQAVPVYLSEMAPAHLRGALNIMFQLATTTGILVAQLVNYGTHRIRGWGWRLSLASAGLPALVLLIGSVFLPDSPASLAARGQPDRARAVLKRIRGRRCDIEREWAGVAAARDYAQQAGNSWRLLFSRGYRAELLVGASVAFFSQINGINAVLFYVPVIFTALGASQQAALLSAVAVGGTMVVGTVVSLLLVDRVGRRPLLIEGGVQMLAAEVTVAGLLASSGGGLSEGHARALLALFCVFAAGFAWSWGPLGWLIPSEIQPLETRSAGQSFATAVNFMVAFAIGQSFLATLCAMRWGTFLFYGTPHLLVFSMQHRAFVAVMTAFAAVCMAETRGVPLEAMRELWRAHWFWRGALALTGAGSEHPHRVSASDGGGPQKGPDGAQDGTNGPRGVKRPSAQPLVDGAGGSPPSRGTGQARADKV